MIGLCKGAMLALLFSLLASTVSRAAGISISFPVVLAVQNGRGAARILFRAAPIPFTERTVIERAILRIPFTGEVESRSLPLRVCLVTEDWSRGGTWDTRYDPYLLSRGEADLRAGSGVATFDVTALLKEMLEYGTYADGFVLTAGRKDRQGITEAEAARFASLEGAELRVWTTMFPSKRPRIAIDGGG
jgi:hypothetical protein